jgi:hypothetical protein
MLSLSKTLVRFSQRNRERSRVILLKWRYAWMHGLLIGPQSMFLVLPGCHAFSRDWRLSALPLFHLCLWILPIRRTCLVYPIRKFGHYPKTPLAYPMKTVIKIPPQCPFYLSRLQLPINSNTGLGGTSTLSTASTVGVPGTKSMFSHFHKTPCRRLSTPK